MKRKVWIFRTILIYCNIFLKIPVSANHNNKTTKTLYSPSQKKKYNWTEIPSHHQHLEMNNLIESISINQCWIVAVSTVWKRSIRRGITVCGFLKCISIVNKCPSKPLKNTPKTKKKQRICCRICRYCNTTHLLLKVQVKWSLICSRNKPEYLASSWHHLTFCINYDFSLDLVIWYDKYRYL